MKLRAEEFTTLRASHFAPIPEVTGAGHVKSFAETWNWLEPLLSRVPITRVYDATPIDVVGLPVWSAVAPMARDLTVHAGKGTTAQAAKISAVMEAIERTSAEELSPDRVVRGSYRDLMNSDAIDPALFDLSFDTGYTPDTKVMWTGAYDLISGRHSLVPADLVISPAAEEMCTGPETNGLASGNTYTEATLHALYEVVERNSVSAEDFYHTHHDPMWSRNRGLRIIDPASLPERVSELVAKLAGNGLDVCIDEVSAGVDIPVIRVTLLDEYFPGYEGRTTSFLGCGADLNPARAAIRAITEAAQAHTVVAIGARDEFEGMRPVPQRPAMLQRQNLLRYGPARHPFPADSDTGDLYRNLGEVLRRLRLAGHSRCLVSELTRRDVGVPVVRVLVPGLAAPYGDSSRAPTRRLLEEVV
ncbi:YcaO-like family protein [Amycolatopsis pithecellobii]|uniref:YcaO domain-containing protein n=1 Tax=Amycolatopsis pithecellobii TaxID=664692 RepID=A0A6N7YT98_9PSEU|nr:YcaO-like family protein [Amycolatopsis pithecellobii]MTD56255.1 hypothetical protein [Amycolatopsis pithecellobii]